MPRPAFRPVPPAALVAVLVAACASALLLAGCADAPAPEAYVVRLDGAYFTEAELADALTAVPGGQEAADARAQILEQWITNTLLFNEAQRRGLRDDPEVQRLLEENERSVLVSAMLKRLYEEEDVAPSRADLEAYYERHRDGLRLREPFLRIHHFATPDPDSARVAARLVRAAESDSAWRVVAQRFTLDPGATLDVADHFYPESRLFPSLPDVRSAAQTLRPGAVTVVEGADGLYHVLRVAERAEAGTVPQLAWVEEELRQRIAIQARKQIYAQQVQRLRNEALAREALEIR